MDTAAEVIAWVVLAVVPVGGIYLFWQLHILPEKIAEKRHHPQLEAIKTICLLSLVFGGMLWPIAWIWAYSKPVLHRLAYGHPADRREGTNIEQPATREPAPDSVAELHDELDRLHRRLADIETRDRRHPEEPS